MNLKVLSKLVGSLLLFLAASQTSCLAYAVWGGESGEGLDAVEAFLISIGAALISGLGLLGLGRGADNELLRRESVSVVGLGWIFCTLYGAIPFFLCEPRMGIADSLFESVSGFTATGATVIGDIEALPRSLLLWRVLTQWLGGMGILVLFVALLSSFGAGSKALFRHESSTFDAEGLSPRIQWTSIQLWGIYVFLSLICFLGLRYLGMSNFDAICHAFTTIATGGFSTYNSSIGHFNSLAIELWIIVFMILGAMNFMLYAWTLRRQWDRWRQDEASQILLLILAVATIGIALNLAWRPEGMSFGHGLRVALFQVVAIMTTTGFATADFDQWPAFSVILIVFLMVIGGCAGSTSGGLKVGRFILFFKIVHYQLRTGFRPNQVMKLKLNGNPVTDQFRIDTLFLIAVAGMSVLLGSLIVCLLQPQQDLRTCVSAVLATLFNIGPALGEVGPTRHYGDLNGATKIFLSFLMVLGRLEFYALLVLFMPSLWRRY